MILSFFIKKRVFIDTYTGLIKMIKNQIMDGL